MINLQYRRRTWVIIAVIAVFVTGVSALTAAMNSPHADFQYYTPTRLPSGFSIKDKRIEAGHEDPHDRSINAYELNLRTEDWVYSIVERKYYPNAETQPATTSLSDYDPHSIGVTCKQLTSPTRTTYRLCHWADYGRISVFEVLFVKDGTYIGTTFPTTLDKVIPDSELDRYVDSFQKSDTAGWQVLTGVGWIGRLR